MLYHCIGPPSAKHSNDEHSAYKDHIEGANMHLAADGSESNYGGEIANGRNPYSSVFADVDNLVKQ
eukprot:5613700-Pyramimonas_sp.AAC.1